MHYKKEPRWLRSRTWSYFLPQTYQKHFLQMEQLHRTSTEHFDERPQPSKRARKAQCNQVGQKKKKQKTREKGTDGTCARGGSCEGGKVSAPWEVFTSGVKGGISRDRGRIPVCGRQERATATDSCTCHPVPHPAVRSAHWYGQQLGAEAQASGQTQGEDWGCLQANSLTL